MPPHRDPSYQQVLLGGGPQAITADQPSGETFQWNVSVEHQFPSDIAVTASYSGLSGVHLPIVLQLNTLPDNVIAKASRRSQLRQRQPGKLFPDHAGAQSVLWENFPGSAAESDGDPEPAPAAISRVRRPGK